MTYVKVGPFGNWSDTPPIDAGFLNGVENQLVTLTAYTAPAPSGGDDTAVLQNLLNQAQSTGGTLVLGPGTYKANLATNQSFTQPRIVGQGMKLTTIQGTVTTSPVLRFKGGSGQQAGGYFADFTISNTAGIGIQIADANGISWNRVFLTGALAEGIQFVNESSGAFTEYNAGDLIIDSTVALPVHYAVTSGNNSFHGTGLTQGTVINLPTSGIGPVIKIDSGAFPYAAPLTAAVFLRGNNAVMIRNDSTASPSFFGHLDVEIQGGATGVMLADPAGQVVLFQGAVSGLITGSGAHLGKLYRVTKVYYQSGIAYVDFERINRSTVLASGTTTIFPDSIGSVLIQVDITAANYHYAYLLSCWQSPYDAGGTVTVLATQQTLNTAGLGAPTFAWTGYGLTITNAAYSSSVTAYVSAAQLYSSPNQSDTFRQ